MLYDESGGNMGRMVILAVVAAAPAMLLAASPASTDAGNKVRAALSRHDLIAAAAAYDALVEARLPAKETNLPDPLLDRLLVEQMITGGYPPPEPILQRLAGDAAAADHVHLELLLATAEENLGQLDAAQHRYAAVSTSDRATTDEKLSAELGSARLLLGTDPATASARLTAIPLTAIPARRRWEIDLLASRAAAISSPNDQRTSDALLAKAWAEAVDADLADHAIVRVSGDFAMAAARRGDRAKLVTLIAIDRTNRNANEGHKGISANLPVCGQSGVTQDDIVIVAFQRIPPPERPRAELVWASRPGIGNIFLNAARSSGQFMVTDGTVASLALRCRAAPSQSYAASIKLDGVIGGWMTGKGAYPVNVIDGDATQLGASLASRTARYGMTSIIRLPLLLQMSNNLLPQVVAGTMDGARVTDFVSQISSVLVANSAPEEVQLAWRLTATFMSTSAKAITPAQALTEVQSVLLLAAKNPAMSRDMLYELAVNLNAQPAAPIVFKDAVMASTLKLLLRDRRDDPRATALALQLHGLRAQNNDLGGAKSAISGLGIAPDLCALASPEPKMISSNLRSDDYPSDITYTQIRGNNATEYDLDATGQAVNGRIIVSDPPYIFDDATRQGISTIRFNPVRREGKAQACRGVPQTIIWQIPY